MWGWLTVEGGPTKFDYPFSSLSTRTVVAAYAVVSMSR